MSKYFKLDDVKGANKPQDGCTCGAHHTSNPGYHLAYCDYKAAKVDKCGECNYKNLHNGQCIYLHVCYREEYV